VVNYLGYRHSVFDSGEPQSGADVQLTLDLELQARAEAALRGHRGAAVVMDAHRGDVLVLASAPTFDPGLFTTTMSTQTWASLTNEYRKPLLNRATAGIYAPGSIFKMVVGLAALENGLDPAEAIYNPGFIEVAGRSIKDEVAPGRYDFRRAFLKSSNTYFIHHGLRLGGDSVGSLEKLNSIVARLHLGEETGIPVMQERSGSYPTRDAIRRRGWAPGDMANLCIGQGPIAVTPLQMAVMTAAVVNGGDVLWPRIVERIVPADGAPEIAPAVPAGAVRDRLGVSEGSLRVVRGAMLADVTDPEGTGREAAVSGMIIGGKTGTAQVTEGRRVVDHITWFASFAETQQRLYSVVVMVESGEGGGRTCAPIARQMFQAIEQWERQSGQLAFDEQGRGGTR
jgi:penicillin-binding protein 2